MRTLLLVALIVVSACFDEEYAFEQFQRFIKKYNKQYDSVEEFMARFQVFANSIRGPNLLGLSYKTGITKFSDMTRQEFRRTYLNLNFNALAGLNLQPANFVRTNDAAPDELNFIEQGYLQGVKDQGSCGSCFAFATIANIEGLYFTKYGKNKEFSEQIIVDCDTEILDAMDDLWNLLLNGLNLMVVLCQWLIIHTKVENNLAKLIKLNMTLMLLLLDGKN
jgi:hypothetical protein